MRTFNFRARNIKAVASAIANGTFKSFASAGRTDRDYL